MDLLRDATGRYGLPWTTEELELHRRFLETMRGFLRSTMNVLREIPAAGAVHASLARAAGHIDRVNSLWHPLAPSLGGPSPDRAVDLGASMNLLDTALKHIHEAVKALSALLRGREQERSPETYCLVDAERTLYGVRDGIGWLRWFLFGDGNLMATGGDR